jgi:DNA-binding IclR family transcriptional regulator
MTMAEPEGKTVQYQAPAVDKALDILEYLSLQRGGATLKEMAEGLGRSTGEIYRVALALERRFYIYKDAETDRFTLSMRLFELSHRYPPSARLIGAALPVMERLSQEIEQSCHLGVIDGERLLVLASVDSPLSMHYRVKLGSSFPLLETSSGVLLVAFSRAEVRETLLSDLLPDDRGAIESRMAEIQQTDREIRPSDVIDGVMNVTAAVRDTSGKVLAALTTPHLKRRHAQLSDAEVMRQTAEAAARISHALGYQKEQDP